ncbi:amidase [Tenacibaculum sp. E3R01]|uniref:amidase family protein n=1 Tax=Tenacibaculum sp. E3R01 TaxID=2267227 RepID=UPI000DE82F12|nr:amidase family protein [Tenacibaculum sp. E3R01]RBW58240.1 amidase [Tenacibaculum sp. E3R01]
MKKLFFIFVFIVILVACKKESIKISFKKYNETSEIKEQQSHENPRMKFKLIQSKYLDLGKVFKPFEKELASFSEKEYQRLKPFILEQNIPSIQKSISENIFNYEKLTLFYLYRIRKFEMDSSRSLNAIISLNPKVLDEARTRDKNKVKDFSSVYGMPILLKDNINTKEMPTTAGASILKNNITKDAFIVERLKESGALILGKANLSEWAYFFCNGCPLGYSAIGGQTLNPYGRKKFETGGSSSGSGVSIAANYAVAAIGTETSGSITSPSSQNSVVGLKPTVGLLSRSGIIPISSTLDTPGPMTKSVIDNALILEAMVGYDKLDTITNMVKSMKNDYNTIEWNSDYLKGKKIGVLTALLSDSIYKEAISKLKLAEVELLELAPEEMNYEGFLNLLTTEMKHDLPNYFKSLNNSSNTITSVEKIVNFNKKDSLLRIPYGQELFMGIVKDTTSKEELKTIKLKLRKEGEKYFEALKQDKVEVIVSINNYHSGIAAVSNYPTLTVPMGYKVTGEPISLTFIAKPKSEKKLLAFGYAFEQLTKVRKNPEVYN